MGRVFFWYHGVLEQGFPSRVGFEGLKFRF